MSVTWIVRCSECGGFGAAEFYVDEELEATDIEQIKEKLFEYQANDYFPPMDSAYNCCKLRSSMQMYVGIDCDLCYKPAGKYAIDNISGRRAEAKCARWVTCKIPFANGHGQILDFCPTCSSRNLCRTIFQCARANESLRKDATYASAR